MFYLLLCSFAWCITFSSSPTGDFALLEFFVTMLLAFKLEFLAGPVEISEGVSELITAASSFYVLQTQRHINSLIDATRRLPSHPPAPLFTISPCSSVLASALVLLSGDIGTSGAGTKATFRAASKLTFVLRFKLTFMCTGPHDTHRQHNSRVSQFSSC